MGFDALCSESGDLSSPLILWASDVLSTSAGSGVMTSEPSDDFGLEEMVQCEVTRRQAVGGMTDERL